MKIAFAIHDVNEHGGQERSTLEIINRFATNNEVHVFAASASGLADSVHFHKIPILLRRPLFIKDFFFRIFVTIKLILLRAELIHITGSCSFVADIVTVQFCQKRWSIEKKKMARNFGYNYIRESFQMNYDLLSELIVYKILRKKLFIALCEDDACDLKNFYQIDKVKIIPHGVDLQKFGPDKNIYTEVRSRLKIKTEETVLLFVGTFNRKGLFYLLPAFGKLAFQYNLKLCVVGLGDFNHANEIVSSLGIKDRVIFLGQRNPIIPFYQAADIFVLPSTYDPFGLVGIEALACGLPSIISKQSGVSQFITPYANGLVLSDPHSSEEIHAKLTVLIESKLALKIMGAKARESVMMQSWDLVWPHYEKLFSQVKAIR
jgi:glycosyltransferase involved in cell wall biosynthesis